MKLIVTFMLCALLFIILNGCSVSIGIGLHPRKADMPEHDAANPVGFVEGRAPITEKIDAVCVHYSSIPDYEDGYGFNVCGVVLRVQ